MLVGYAGRTTLETSEDNPKWETAGGIAQELRLRAGTLRSDEAAHPLRSFWGPLWFHEHGLQAASLMGSEMTEEQERCLDPYPTITVAFDNDAAGVEKATGISERLKTNTAY